jgi:hypothetical protein
MIPKIENGAELFVEEKACFMINEIDEKRANYDVEMSRKTSNTGDARQKRES